MGFASTWEMRLTAPIPRPERTLTGDLHVQTVNSRHSRLKDFLRPRRGIATRYLDNYLSWFHLVGLAPGANDRACLAAVTR